MGNGNDTTCSGTSTCSIMTGVTTNTTFFVAQYNPDAPVIDWRQKMELATIIICNSLTCTVMILRIWYRWFKLKRYRGDDMWMSFALFIMIGYTIAQIGTNRNGSGLHFVNVKHDWRQMHWRFMIGWSGYWIVVSCIKMSVCFFFLQILTPHHKSLRYGTIALSCLIFSLGMVMFWSWMFQCQPILSNFLWRIDPDTCVNYDIFRWLWITVSVPIDVAIMSVPIRILRQTSLRTHEKRILRLVFCATLLGTVTCVIGIFGAYQTRTLGANDGFWAEVPWIMMNDIEVLMYTLGASFPVLSRYIVQRIDTGQSTQHLNFTSWARQIPDFFSQRTERTRSMHHRSGNGRELTYVIELQSAEREQAQAAGRVDSVAQEGAPAQSFKSGPSEPDSMCDMDLEKGTVQTEVRAVQ